MSVRPILMLTVGLLLGGCHGGGSVQPAPLQVVSQCPAPGSIAEVDVSIALAFATDPAPDPATFSANSLQVRDGSGLLPGSAAYDEATLTLTWISERELPRGALLTVEVSDAVRGANGNSLPAGLTWSFRVRAGVAAMPVTIKSGVTTSIYKVYVGFGLDGSSVIALRDESWPWTANGLGPAEPLPGFATGLHVDGAGNAVAVLQSTGTSANIDVSVTNRPAGGTWSPRETVFTSSGHFATATLVGNERGDVMLHSFFGFLTPHVNSQVLHVRPAVASVGWLQFPVTYGGATAPPQVISTLDGLGRVTTMLPATGFGSNGFQLVDRWDPLQGSSSMYTLAQGNAFGGTIAGDREGGLRAIWYQDGQVRMSRAPANAGFGLVVPGQPPSSGLATWHPAQNGAMVVRQNTLAWRAEGGSDGWSMTDVEGLPLATAMSPRGEALMVCYQSSSVFVVRWRAGDTVDAPLPLGTFQSPWNMLFAAAVDDVGRAVVIYTTSNPSDLIGVRVE